MKIYNTMTRKKKNCAAARGQSGHLPAAALTVYNYFHIGNARPFIIFDTLRRHLEHMGYGGDVRRISPMGR